jgi:hypothetical protein
MSKHRVQIICWKCSHVTELSLNKAQEEKLQKNTPLLKKVCPVCKPDNQEIIVTKGNTIIYPMKPYKCSDNHLTLIGNLDTMLHVKFGSKHDQFVNVEGNIHELDLLIDNGDIVCHNDSNGLCGKHLEALDDVQLERATPPNIKTKTRVGDIWSKKGIEPVRPGTYKNGEYQDSRTQNLNKERLKNLKQERLIDKKRLAGRNVIDKATQTDYGYRDKSSINPDKLDM